MEFIRRRAFEDAVVIRICFDDLKKDRRPHLMREPFKLASCLAYILLRPVELSCQHIGNFVENGVGYRKAKLPRARQSEKLIWIAAPGGQSGDVDVGIGGDAQHLAPARSILVAHFLDKTRHVSFR